MLLLRLVVVGLVGWLWEFEGAAAVGEGAGEEVGEEWTGAACECCAELVGEVGLEDDASADLLDGAGDGFGEGVFTGCGGELAEGVGGEEWGGGKGGKGGEEGGVAGGVPGVGFVVVDPSGEERDPCGEWPVVGLVEWLGFVWILRGGAWFEESSDVVAECAEPA